MKRLCTTPPHKLCNSRSFMKDCALLALVKFCGPFTLQRLCTRLLYEKLFTLLARESLSTLFTREELCVCLDPSWKVAYAVHRWKIVCAQILHERFCTLSPVKDFVRNLLKEVFFFLDFLSWTFTVYRIGGKRETISLIHLYHIQPDPRHLGISWAITAESSLLHIAINRARTHSYQPGSNRVSLICERNSQTTKLRALLCALPDCERLYTPICFLFCLVCKNRSGSKTYGVKTILNSFRVCESCYNGSAQFEFWFLMNVVEGRMESLSNV